jgi:hypothetical protein
VSDIIDLSIRRAQREASKGPARPATDIHAHRGKVRVQLADAEGNLWPSAAEVWEFDPEAARDFAMRLLETSHEALSQLAEPCPACGARGCRKPHPGQRWRRLRLDLGPQSIIVEARCKRSWRVRDLATGQRLWVKTLSWAWTFEGWGPELGTVETKESS